MCDIEYAPTLDHALPSRLHRSPRSSGLQPTPNFFAQQEAWLRPTGAGVPGLYLAGQDVSQPRLAPFHPVPTRFKRFTTWSLLLPHPPTPLAPLGEARGACAMHSLISRRLVALPFCLLSDEASECFPPS